MASRRDLLKNFGSLSAVQIANYVFPLITVPYIVRTVGPEKFGAVSFAAAVVAYFTLLTDWGINLYAPREITLVKEDRRELSVLTSNIVYLKVFSILIGTILFVLAVFAVPQFRQERLLFLVTSAYIFLAGFNPIWFFQGIERMSHIAAANFLSGLGSVAFILLFVRHDADYIKIPLAYVIAGVISRIYIFSIMFAQEHFAFTQPDKKVIAKIVKDSSPLFISNIAINIYTGINTVILGFLAGNVAVGYYSMAEKILKALLGVQAQISTVLYPHISGRVKASPDDAERAIKKGFVAVMLFAIPLSLFSLFLAEGAVKLVAGVHFGPSVPVLMILSALFIVVGLSNIFGIQMLLSFGKRKEFMRPLMFAGSINLVLNFLLIPAFAHIGAAMAFLVAELSVTLIMFFEVRKMGLRVIETATARKLLLLAGLTSVVLLAFKASQINAVAVAVISAAAYVAMVISLKVVNLRERTIIA